jgi:protein pelota
VSQQTKDVKLGAHHTLDIEANRDVRIIKILWDSVALGRVEDACIEGRDAEIGAIVCGEGWLLSSVSLST